MRTTITKSSPAGTTEKVFETWSWIRAADREFSIAEYFEMEVFWDRLRGLPIVPTGLRIVSGQAFGAGCAKEGLKPGFSPYPSRTAARLFLELLSTECPSVSVHQLGVDVATLWLRHGCPWSIGCGDPRSQKRDLGHPSRFSDTVRSGGHEMPAMNHICVTNPPLDSLYKPSTSVDLQ